MKERIINRLRVLASRLGMEFQRTMDIVTMFEGEYGVTITVNDTEITLEYHFVQEKPGRLSLAEMKTLARYTRWEYAFRKELEIQLDELPVEIN